jgi:hypothetical protein
MSLLFAYFWPPFAAALILGLIGGRIAFSRPKQRHVARGTGLLLALIFAAVWHGPLGAGQRLAAHIDRDAQLTLVYYELAGFTAHVNRAPLSRRVMLAGPANDFQRTELPRTMDTLPGVASARWEPAGGGVPMIAESAASALLGFLLGLLLAYLIELHIRYNAQWNW